MVVLVVLYVDEAGFCRAEGFGIRTLGSWSKRVWVSISGVCMDSGFRIQGFRV